MERELKTITSLTSKSFDLVALKVKERSHNPLLALVGDSIREQYTLLCQKSVQTTLEWNEGNHFHDPEVRMATGWSWLLNHIIQS